MRFITQRPGHPSDESSLRWLVAVPPIAVTIIACVIAIGARADIQMFAADPPQNPSEAAIRRNLPALVTFRQGGDLRRRYPLRPDFSEFNVRAATPLEASILSRSGDLVRFAMRMAPSLNAAEREAAVCLAIDVHADADAIDALVADGPRPQCVENASLRQLQDAR